MNYTDEFKSVVLGALLHDIGKFWQRADNEINYEKSNIITEQTRKNITNICPVWNNRYSHKHSLWTNEFFEKFENEIKMHFDDYNALGQDNPANLASYHHNPSNDLQYLIRIADWMSSGVDRSNSKDYEDEEDITGYKFKKVRLRPVFENVSFDKEFEYNPKYYYEIDSLKNAGSEIFPKTIENLHPKFNEYLVENYEKIWNKFEDDFKNQYSNSFYQFIDNLLSLLENYTWSIASSTSELPDISLYDHLKTTTAIASCLYKFHNGIINKKELRNEKEEKFILVGGDLNGIQKYIFDLVHTSINKVTSILRARSFYLTVFPNIIVTKIVLDLGMTPANCLLNSGGRFILLLPNTKDTKNYLENFTCIIKDWCKEEFFNELTLNLDWEITLNYGDFLNDVFKNKLDLLKENLEIKKLQKLNYLQDVDWKAGALVIDKYYDKLKMNDNEVCQVCGKKPAGITILERKSDIPEIEKICESCDKQRIIGKKLTKSSLLGISKTEPKSESYLKFFDSKEAIFLILAKDFNELKNNTELITAESLTETENTTFFIKQNYIANHVPRFNSIESDLYRNYYNEYGTEEEKNDIDRIKDKNQKTFADISIPKNKINGNDNDKKKGTHLLAIIKADVDSLGRIFSSGLRGKISISRYATMSRMLNLFFTGYLNNLLEEQFKNIYTVYAGGDDLFLIGNWEEIIEFAPELNRKFRNYTCQNEDIHLSAGITLIKPRRPINKAADLAEENLEKAKNAGKDRIAIFDTELPWNDFDKIQKEWFAFFDDAVNNKNSNINSSFLYRLLTYRQMALEYIENKKVDGLMYISKLSYDLKRNIERREGQPKKIINEDELALLSKLQDIEVIKNIHIPIYYTLYKNRGGK